MKHKAIIIIVFLCSIISVNAQKQLDISYLECSYRFTLMKDTIGKIKTVRSSDMRLLIGNKYSKFYSHTTFLSDSARTSKSRVEREKLFENNAIGIIELLKQYPLDESYEIYKDYEKNTIVSTDMIPPSNHVLYNEPIHKQNWKILNETKQIAGYNCQKATCRFRGRNYEAWFTREIPVNEGPWKFNGLPGLIVKVYDIKEHYDFELYMVQKVTKPIIFNYFEILDNIQYQEISIKDYIKVKRNYIKNPYAGQSVTFRRSDGTEFIPQNLYDAIELDIK